VSGFTAGGPLMNRDGGDSGLREIATAAVEAGQRIRNPSLSASSPVDDCAALPVQAIVNELFGETRRIRAKLLFLQLDAGL